MRKENYPISRKTELVVQEVGDEILIYDLKKNEAFQLNRTSKLVWEACTGKNSINGITEILRKQLTAVISIDLVLIALEDLRNRNLIENYAEFSFKYTTSNRREIIRKLGITSAVALPIIASIVAPTSANAMSCSPCSAPNNRMPSCSCDVDIGGGVLIGDNSLCCSLSCGGVVNNRVCN